MRTHLRLLTLVVALGATLVPSTTRAHGVRLGLGADYWLERSGVFELTLGADTHIARHLTLGGRFGALLATSPNTFGVPLDLQLRAELGSAYVEGLAGPWIMFGGDFVRGHAAFGFGLKGRAAEVGLEVGWLDPATMVGLRVAMRL